MEQAARTPAPPSVAEEIYRERKRVVAGLDFSMVSALKLTKRQLVLNYIISE